MRLYHGTSRKALGSIRKRGLAAKSYLTTSLEAAEQYAGRASALTPRGAVCSCAVLTLEIPTDAIIVDPERSVLEPLAPPELQGERWPGSKQYATVRPLPPSAIVDVQRFTTTLTPVVRREMIESIKCCRATQSRLLDDLVALKGAA